MHVNEAVTFLDWGSLSLVHNLNQTNKGLVVAVAVPSGLDTFFFTLLHLHDVHTLVSQNTQQADEDLLGCFEQPHVDVSFYNYFLLRECKPMRSQAGKLILNVALILAYKRLSSLHMW